MLFRKKKGTYVGSYFVSTSSSLEMIKALWVVLPENCDKTDEVGAKISDSLKFGILGL